MSSSILLLILLAVMVLSVLRHALTRSLRRRDGICAVLDADASFASGTSAAQHHVCPQCGGAGCVTRMQESMQPRSETSPEFYTDTHGRPATRMVTRLRMVSAMQPVRIPCASCGGTGGRPS